MIEYKSTVKTSTTKEVRELYDESADSYAAMMDTEIELPVYADLLSRLAKRIVELPGTVIDTSCGSGHMLSRYRQRYDRKRALLGIDLSPRMVAIASDKMGTGAEVISGDMRDLSAVESESSAAVLSFFALHHLSPEEVPAAFREWHRVLATGGQLLIAAWEGKGPIDYGETSAVVALRYGKDEIAAWIRAAGFAVDRCLVEPVEEMPMQAIYAEATKQ